MAIFQQGETYQHVRKFRENSTPTDVTSASMNITYPCNSGATDIAMAKVVTGTYQAFWDIPSSATYGEYVVEITALTGTTTSKFVSSFYILPWNITQQIRSVSGIKQSNDISDDDIAIVAWNSYLECKEQVFYRILEEPLKCDLGHCIDGTNKVFYTHEDNLVTGHTVCDEEDITGWYYDDNLDKEFATVSITTAGTGKLSVADKDGNALSCNTCSVHISYRVHTESYSEQLFKKAIVYLASHEVILRFNELDKATLGDLNSNRPIILANPDRMYNKYKKTLKIIKKANVGGMVDNE